MNRSHRSLWWAAALCELLYLERWSDLFLRAGVRELGSPCMWAVTNGGRPDTLHRGPGLGSLESHPFRPGPWPWEVPSWAGCASAHPPCNPHGETEVAGPWVRCWSELYCKIGRKNQKEVLPGRSQGCLLCPVWCSLCQELCPLQTLLGEKSARAFCPWPKTKGLSRNQQLLDSTRFSRCCARYLYSLSFFLSIAKSQDEVIQFLF